MKKFTEASTTELKTMLRELKKTNMMPSVPKTWS